MTVKIKFYAGMKYDLKEEPFAEHAYDITGFEVIDGGDAAEEIEYYTDDSGIDECHEYLVLQIQGGTTATFRNSHVEMFRC